MTDGKVEPGLLESLGLSLRTAEEWQATLIDAIESISEAFGLFDAQDRLILCNRRYAQTFTIHDSFKEIEGWHFADLVRASVAKGEVIEPEFAGDIESWVKERHRRHRTPGGSMRQIQLGDGSWLQVSERPTRSGGIVGVRTDVTALKSAQHAAEAANESKTRFLRNMSHEIRTPMNGVLGMAQLLAESRLDPMQRRYVAAIEQSGRHLLRIINDILDFSKVEAGLIELETTELDLVSLVEECAAMLVQPAQSKGLELVVDIDPELRFRVEGDPLRLQQIVINLLSNAIKFTERGEILLTLRQRGGSPERIDFTISVKDSGVGIAPELHERIFDHFAQADSSTARKFGGTGLGLTICRQLARLMGGDITLESEPGRGSIFHVELSLKRGAARGLPAEAEKPEEAGPGLPLMAGQVLLAEDNEVNKTIVLAWLRRLGFAARHARNGLEAVAAMREQSFDLVLMDCQMPEMDGFAATQEIRRMEEGSGRHTPIIALTAHAIDGDRESCLRAGMDDYLTKPFKGEQLSAVISRWLAGSGTAGNIRLAAIKPEAQEALTAVTSHCETLAASGDRQGLAAMQEELSRALAHLAALRDGL